ncbi:SDR family oxidoreductase [Sphingobium lignivorans]|uniref:NAD(P)-dependent dehydrogenase (Short-subunit alcohol dehydrogenase family) n=1 Tax=Sphingobium lignivorans TaxID=2735886 RepID=A0ABR6NJC0_9SPHN|nr:SDR family oxidoreductase [Sphingobium lignivorans]MBB5987374.1 NAD(P)-dependent dehydrogenase (short-subunit alcohol dehydrogenase family) [Sphingobium lignivorans]
MPARLKPLDQQVIVITGASSGHGLATARMAAAAGARVMLAARDEEALREICNDIRAEGGRADYVVTDVGDEAQVQRLADQTIARFGGFDCWVNNAGIGIYSELLDTPIEDHRKIFETNYWGVVHGSLAAVRHLKGKNGGGAIINVGSINSDMSGPLLGAYNASKHAVKGFTDALRIEMKADDAPISITLIKPSAIGTPFTEHGRNMTGYEARLPQPIYSPEIVAHAILDAAQHPRRAITVGAGGKLQVLGAVLFPSLFDRIATGMRDSLLYKDRPQPPVEGNLYEPQGNDGRAEGRQQGRKFSLFTTGRTHPAATLAMVAATGVGGALLYALQKGRPAIAGSR